MALDPRPHIYTQDKFDFLKKNKTVVDLATILMEVESKYEGDYPKRPHEERYRDIRTCLKSHSDRLDDFEALTTQLLDHFQRAKTFLFETGWAKNLRIDENMNLVNIRKQFEKIMMAIQTEIHAARQVVEAIKELDDELLYCFFNYEAWGSTWCSELYIPRQDYRSRSREEIIEIAKCRILNLQRANHLSLAQEVWSDYQQELYHRLEEEYPNYVYTDHDWFIINARICHEIHGYFKRVIEKFRDACRRVLTEINKYRDEVCTLNDPIFKNIFTRMTERLESDKDYKVVLSQRVLRERYNTLLRLLYDYKKEVEESEWRVTSQFENEDCFKRHLFNYLIRTRNENLRITKESERVRGKVDIQINNNVVLELKFSKTPVRMSSLRKSLPQLREVMENWQSKLGFLVVLDIAKQERPLASRENYFWAGVERGGRGIEPEEDTFPVGVVSMLIFGGERIEPSHMTAST